MASKPAWRYRVRASKALKTQLRKKFEADILALALSGFASSLTNTTPDELLAKICAEITRRWKTSDQRQDTKYLRTTVRNAFDYWWRNPQ